MESVLQRFDSNQQISVKECIMKAVEGMNDEGRLETALKVVEIGLEQEEQLQEVVTGTWRLILQGEWWRARYESLTEFMMKCGMSESVKELMNGRMRSERLKRKFEKSASERLGGGDLKERLGEELMPARMSKGFLEAINALTKQVKDAEDAKELLSRAMDRRLGVRGASNDEKLRVGDVKAAMKEVMARGAKRSRIMEAEAEDERESGLNSKSMERSNDLIKDKGRAESTGGESRESMKDVEAVESMKDVDAVESMEDVEDVDSEGEMECGCREVTFAKGIIDAMRRLRKKDVKGRVKAAGSIGVKEWREMCHRHMRGIASCWGLKTSGVKREQLIERVMEVQRNVERLDEVRTAEGTYLWFRMEGRPGREDDGLGPFKYVGAREDEFTFDRAQIWKRYGGMGTMEKFLEDGNVVMRGVFGWIMKDSELMEMVNAEFEMYRHHLREQNGKSNYGWCRNMWHSLVQQVMRQDPVFYALNVVARPDGNWRLVSFPYYTKYAMKADSTGFKHIDINIEKLLKSGRGGSTVQTAISLDDEFEDGCTIVVPGFHRHIGEWWSKVEERGKSRNGLVQSVEDLYLKEDEEMYGSFVPVVCKRGDIRMSLSSLIHGSTGGCVRRRRVVHPWLIGVDSDHDGLEIEESGSWEDVSRAHRNMWAMKVGATGQSHRFGVGNGRFAGCVEIRGVSGIGDALVGARRWDSGLVLMERDAIVGGSEGEAWRVVERHRSRMKVAWKEGFEVMMSLEKMKFGDRSYFKLVEESSNMDVLAQAACWMK